MANWSSSKTTGSLSASIAGSTTPKVYNVSASIASTEYSQALSANTKQFIIQVRGGSAKMRVGFAVGESTTNYITVEYGVSMCQQGLDFGGTLYFQTNKASQIVEILEWT